MRLPTILIIVGLIIGMFVWVTGGVLNCNPLDLWYKGLVWLDLRAEHGGWQRAIALWIVVHVIADAVGAIILGVLIKKGKIKWKDNS